MRLRKDFYFCWLVSRLAIFVVALAAVTISAIGIMSLFAPAASATDANVAYTQTCDTATVAVTSHWDGGVIHIHVTGPVPEVGFDVAPLATASTHFKIIPNPLHVTVSSSNGILHGTLTHTFTAEQCAGQPPTTPVPPTTTPGVVPPGGPVTTVAPPPSSSPPSSLEPFPTTTVVTAPPLSVPASNVPAAPTTTHPTIAALPHTGAGDWLLLIAAIGIFAVLVGMALISAKQLDRWKKGER